MSKSVTPEDRADLRWYVTEREQDLASLHCALAAGSGGGGTDHEPSERQLRAVRRDRRVRATLARMPALDAGVLLAWVDPRPLPGVWILTRATYGAYARVARAIRLVETPVDTETTVRASDAERRVARQLDACARAVARAEAAWVAAVRLDVAGEVARLVGEAA